MTNSDTKNFSQNVSSSYHLEDRGKCNKNTCANTCNVPKLRFKGYNDEWKKVRTEEIFENVTIKNKPSLPVLAVTQERGTILRESCGINIKYENESLKSYKLVKPGNFIISLRSFQGGLEYSGLEGIVSPAYTILNNKQSISYDFFKYYFKTYNFIKSLNIAVEGIRDGKQISYNSFKDIKITFPNIEEQEKIASFLTLIDKKIEKQKELVELLKKYKRGLLSSIFSQKLRFKDNNGNDYPAWEECRFDEIFKILGNNTLSRECLNYTNVGVKNIHYGDILVKYNTCINDEINQIPNINFDINLDKISDDNYLKVGDVILADTAEDYTVGKTCEIVSCKAKILSGLHTIPCRPKRNFAKGYLGYYLNSTEYHDKLIPLITGIKVSAISKKEIKKTIIKYPIYKEQEKIANLLLLIENKLNSNIKKLELFETYKKGLLQQLFI